MATTTFSGPILAGTIKNTTGTTVGTDMKNTGYVVMAQTFSLDYSNTTDKTTDVIIPAYSQIVRFFIDVTTAFDGTGVNGLSIGSVAGGAGTEFVNTFDLSTTAGSKFPTTEAGETGAWTDVGTTDVRLTGKVTDVGADGTAGVVQITVLYVQNNNLS